MFKFSIPLLKERIKTLAANIEVNQKDYDILIREATHHKTMICDKKVELATLESELDYMEYKQRLSDDT